MLGLDLLAQPLTWEGAEVGYDTQKFSARYSGPFCILDQIGKVAYSLQPSEMTIRSVFHISRLKARNIELNPQTYLGWD